MNQIKLFSNDELGIQVRTIMNDDGSISINAEDTAIGFGWYEEKSGKVYPRWRTINGYLKEFGFSQEVAKEDFIPESLYYMLGMKAGNERAVKYQKWLAMEVLPCIRKTGSYNVSKPICIEDVLIESLQEMKAMKEQFAKHDKEITSVKDRVESIREVVALDTTSWREETSNILKKIGHSLGGGQIYSQVRTESYELLEKRMGVSLATRLTNKRRRMADEGICKSKRDKLSYVDIIAEDKKLIEGYMAIVKEMAIRYGVA